MEKTVLNEGKQETIHTGEMYSFVLTNGLDAQIGSSKKHYLLASSIRKTIKNRKINYLTSHSLLKVAKSTFHLFRPGTRKEVKNKGTFIE
jgi:hypothetical protein